MSLPSIAGSWLRLALVLLALAGCATPALEANSIQDLGLLAFERDLEAGLYPSTPDVLRSYEVVDWTEGLTPTVAVRYLEDGRQRYAVYQARRTNQGWRALEDG